MLYWGIVYITELEVVLCLFMNIFAANAVRPLKKWSVFPKRSGHRPARPARVRIRTRKFQPLPRLGALHPEHPVLAAAAAQAVVLAELDNPFPAVCRFQ